jgi:NADH dehydrogenase
MDIIVLGAGYAGVTAALRLARETHGAAQITLVNAREQFVERIRLHEVAAGRPPRPRSVADMLAGSGVALRIGAVRVLDLGARRVRVDDEFLTWDRVVIALGSQVDVSRVPGAREHAFTLDAQRAAVLAARLPQLAAARERLVIVGGGLTAIEAASELAEAFPALRISLVSGGPIGEELSERARDYIRSQLTAAGVELVEGVKVERVESRAIVTERGVRECAACLWAAGFEAPGLLRDAGFEVNERGQVLVDRTMRSLSHPDVYVVGDLAQLSPAFGPPFPMGCKSAGPTGAHAATNLARELAGKSTRPLHFSVPIYCLSLGRRDGLIQFRSRDGSLTGPVWTGVPAAWIKELICRATVWVLAFERRRRPRPLAREQLVSEARV